MTQTLLNIVANYESSLLNGLAAAGTEFALVSNLDDDGNALASGLYGFTINEGQSNEEHVVGTLSGSVVTITIRNVRRNDGITAQTGLSHRKGESVKITNFPSLTRIFNVLNGTTRFDNATTLGYDGNPTISDDGDLATKKYADDLAIAGSPDASTTVKGIVEVATDAEAYASTSTGGTGAKLVISPDNAILDPTAGTPSAINKYVSNQDTTSSSVIAATTISFSDANPDTILDSGNGFVTAGFITGDEITVAGSTSNNGTYIIATVAAGTLTLTSAASLTTEAAGDSVVVQTVGANKLVRNNSKGFLRASVVLARSIATVTAVSNDGEQEVVSVFLPANTLSVAETIEARVFIIDSRLTADTGTPTYTVRLKSGSNVLAQFQENRITTTDLYDGYIDFTIQANNSASNQNTMVHWFLSEANELDNDTFNGGNITIGTNTIDLSADSQLTITIEKEDTGTPQGLFKAGGALITLSNK